MTQKIYIALCPIAIGKKIVAVDEKLPCDVNKAKIEALLKNGSIKEADSQAAATLTGAVTKDGRVVELKALKVEPLKALAKDLEIAGADQMKKEALVEAITAIEFEAPTQE